MRRMLFVFVLLAVVLSVLPPLAALAGETTVLDKTPQETAVQEAVRDQCPRLEHEITLLRAGTRSEAQQGWLTVDCVLLPDTFQRVVVDGREFVFLQRQHLWGEDGYQPTGRVVKPTYNKGTIKKEDLVRGWYLGQYKLAGTPENWIYVEWAHGRAWVLPAGVKDLVRSEAIEILEREARMDSPAPVGGLRQEIEPQ